MTSPSSNATSRAAPRVIDAHTHIFPTDIVRKREPFCQRDIWFGELYANPKSLLSGVEDLLESMNAAGVGQSIVCGFPWRDPGLCREHNDYMAESCATSSGRLVWLATVSPENVSDAVNEAERCFSRGALGLGELNADAQGFDLVEPRQFNDIAELCVSAQKPILLHASEPLGRLYPGKGSATPDRLIAFLTAFPSLRVVLAHWGGGLPFYELMPDVATAAAGVAYDSAATTYLYRDQIFRTAVDIIGADRVMFGSDFPVLRQDRLLRRVRAMDWRSHDEEAAVLEHTARAVYRVPPPEEITA